MPEAKQENPHKGHRERLKQTFLVNGFDGLPVHNILELLLFYSIPMKDTNGLAHELIKVFGSLANVFDAPYEELLKVKGVSQNTAILIKMIPQICTIYFKEKAQNGTYNGKELTLKIGNELVARCIAETDEVVYLICLDNKLNPVYFDIIARGTVDTVKIVVRKIAEMAIRFNSSAVILAHNHPRGMAMPSKQDKESTEFIYKTLSALSIKLLDHIIVSGEEYCSMARNGTLDPFDFTKAPRSGSTFENADMQDNLDISEIDIDSIDDFEEVLKEQYNSSIADEPFI